MHMVKKEFSCEASILPHFSLKGFTLVLWIWLVVWALVLRIINFLGSSKVFISKLCKFYWVLFWGCSCSFNKCFLFPYHTKIMCNIKTYLVLLCKTSKSYEFSNLAELTSGRGLNSVGCGKSVIVYSAWNFPFVCLRQVLCAKKVTSRSLKGVSVRLGWEGITDGVMLI